MVLIDEPDELGATTPLHLNDLAQSELVLMVKVRINSADTVRFLIFTPF